MEIILECLSDLEIPCCSAAELELSPTIRIGRARDCQVRVADPYVSRHHCELISDCADQPVRVRDLGSENGTYVNETRIHETCELHDGDLLRIATIPFTVRITDAPSPTSP